MTAAGGPRPVPGELRSELLDSLGALERVAPEWEELAARAGRPGTLPAWQLAWWRTLAPPTARPSAVAVRDGERLVGLVPFAREETRVLGARYTLAAADMTHRAEPLADPSVDLRRVAAAALATIAREAAPPASLRLAAVAADGPWVPAFADATPAPRPAWTLEERRQLAPSIDLRHADFDAWLATKSSNFRQQSRRFRRRLEKEGGTIRCSSGPQQLARDVQALVALHHRRWDGRGGSSLQGPIEAMLRDAGERMLAGGGLRLWVVELRGRPISVQLFLAAGGEVLYWNGGFDEDAGHLKPALLGILAGVEDAIARGEQAMDLGGGAQDYKLRMADGTRPLTWTTLVQHDRRYRRNRLALLPHELGLAARSAARGLPAPVQQQLRRVLRRG